MNKKITRGLALALALIMCVSLLIGLVASAAEPTTFTKVTDGTLVSGQYVMVDANGFAPGILDGTWVTAVQPTFEGENMTADNGSVWTLTVEGNAVTLTDANGKKIAPKGGNTNGIQEGDYAWAYTYADGLFSFNGVGEDTVVLASNVGSANKYRAYKTGTVESQGQEKYPTLFTLYKVEGDLPEVPNQPEEPAGFDPTGKTVAEILAAAFALEDGKAFLAPCTLTGKVLRIDTAYDEQYGNVTVTIDVEGKELMCYRLTGEEAAIVAEGDTITVTGTIKNYKGTIEFDAKCTLDTRVPAAPVEPEKEDKVLDFGDKSFTTDKWVYNQAITATEAGKLQMVIYDKSFDGTVETNGWGAAIVLDKYGKLVKIYDAANMGFWTVDGKSADPLTFRAADYSTVAFSELADGETLIIFPNDGVNAPDSARVFALSLRGAGGTKAYCGELATLTGFTFEVEQPPVVEPPVVDPDVPEHGDTTIFFVMALMTVAMTAVVVLTKKNFR